MKSIKLSYKEMTRQFKTHFFYHLDFVDTSGAEVCLMDGENDIGYHFTKSDIYICQQLV